MPISDLINNIAGSVKGLGTALGLFPANSNPKYPVFPQVGINDIDSSTKERWFNYETDRYVFGVINESDALTFDSNGVKAIKSITSLFSGGKAGSDGSGAFGDFKLPLTPQEITQVEDFATLIKPSQGGTVLQHSGNRYKDLMISGTTGVAPFRGSGGVNRLNGQAIFAPDELKYRSGYEVFIHFRNWIKAYVEAKAQGAEQAPLRMIFKNFKDWEFLIVEPLKFSMKRDATKPLLYNYSIQFRVLGHYVPPKINSNFLDTIDKTLNTAKAVMEQGRGICTKFQGIIRSVAGEVDSVIENLRLATLAVKAARGIGITMNDVSNRIDSNYVSQRDALKLTLKLGSASQDLDKHTRNAEGQGVDLETTPSDPTNFGASLISAGKFGTNDPKSKFIQAKAQMGNSVNSIGIEDYPDAARREILREQEKSALMSRAEFEKIRDGIVSLKNRFADAVGLGDDTYDSIYGLISSGDLNPDSDNIDAEFEILYGFKLAIEGMDSILSSDDMFDINSQLYSKTDSSSGADSVGEGIFSFPDPNAGIREGIVPVGASLEDIAYAELGDSARWTELAEMNGLKAPYIDNTASMGKKINYTVKSAGFSDPGDIQGIIVNSYYLVAELPIPSGGWFGKAKKIAQYKGGDQNEVDNWRFITPPIGTVLNVVDHALYLEYSEDLTWVEIEFETIITSEVLRPGDIIKIPTAGTNNPEDFNRGPRDNPITNKLSRSEKALGVDLKLTDSGDLLLLPTGDLAPSFGFENGAQAIVLKLLYGKGELRKHPELGTQLKVGGKVPPIASIRNQIAVTLLQDERIRDVRNINLIQVNNSLQITFDVFFIEVNAPVPITIPI